MKVTASDVDEIQKRCNPWVCNEFDVGANYVADWSILGATAEKNGGFIGSDGRLLESVANTRTVLYLPPRDLGFGVPASPLSRVLTVQAIIKDWNYVGMPQQPTEPTVTVTFTVTVTRHDFGTASGGKYRVVVEPQSVPADIPGDDPCNMGTPPDCCTQDFDETSHSGIVSSLAWGPTNGMLVNELRPIRFWAFDEDKIHIDCGEPPPPGETGSWPCLVTGADLVFRDRVKIDYFLEEGDGELIFEEETDESVIYKAPSVPEHVKIRVTFSDGRPVTDALFDNPVVTWLEFEVFALNFVGQDGSVRPPLTGLSTADLGLQVSCVNSNAGLGSGAPIGSDSRTYRVQVEHPTIFTHVNPMRVSTRVLSCWTGDQYLNVPPYVSVPQQFVQVSGKYISHDDLRLVSNAAPSAGTDPAFMYDDYTGLAGDQYTAYVRLGDWAVAELATVSGSRIGIVELPVEQPWSGTPIGSAAAGPIVQVQLKNWFDADVNHDAAFWSAVQSEQIERGNEDLAQTGVVLKRTVQSVVDGCKRYNNLIVLRAPQSGQSYVAGNYTLNFSDGDPSNGIEHVITTSISGPNGADPGALMVASKLRNAIEDYPGASFSAELLELNFGVLYRVIVVDRGLNDYHNWRFSSLDVPLRVPADSSKPPVPPDNHRVFQLDYHDMLLDLMEACGLAINNRGVLRLSCGSPERRVSPSGLSSRPCTTAISTRRSWGFAPPGRFPT